MPDFVSSHLAASLSPTHPAFEFFSVDSLGQGRVQFNPALSLPQDPVSFRLEKSGADFRYFALYADTPDRPLWTVQFSENIVRLRSECIPSRATFFGTDSSAFSLTFRQKACHATLLGIMPPGESAMCLPCVLHLPDMGSLRITSSVPEAKLGYSASRTAEPPMVRYVHVVFPAATANCPVVEYTLEVAAIHPDLPGIGDDARFDGFRRNFLNMFQVIPRRQMLGTNASSDICPFTLYMFAEAAAPRVRLAGEIHTSDLVRMTADRYLSGVKGYGQVGYEHGVGNYQFLDVDPSLILGSGIYAQSTGDWEWARDKHQAVMERCRLMLMRDRNGNGLIEYETTGNLGDRPTPEQRPANWWDTINFGHEDAYSNALAFRALNVWAQIATTLNFTDDAAWLGRKAARLRAAYLENFFNPETGIFAGWKSADGQLHDYWFLFLNSLVVAYGIVDHELGNKIMTRLLNKLQEVGFQNFRIGLPGNLVPIRRGDYLEDNFGGDSGLARRFGVPQYEDGSDSFQCYENGGASMRFAVFTLRALFRLGRLDEASRMFFPMLEGYKVGDYQGFDAYGISNDWRAWNGAACGYEGFAVGNYLPLLAVVDEWNALREHSKQCK
jgi:hypothetical protein